MSKRPFCGRGGREACLAIQSPVGQLQQNLKRDTPYTVKLTEMEGGIFCLSVSSESEIDRDAIIEAGAAFKLSREYWKFTNELGQ